MNKEFTYQQVGEIFRINVDDEKANITISVGDNDSFLVSSGEDLDVIIAYLQMTKMLVYGENTALTPSERF